MLRERWLASTCRVFARDSAIESTRFRLSNAVLPSWHRVVVFSKVVEVTQLPFVTLPFLHATQSWTRQSNFTTRCPRARKGQSRIWRHSWRGPLSPSAENRPHLATFPSTSIFWHRFSLHINPLGSRGPSHPPTNCVASLTNKAAEHEVVAMRSERQQGCAAPCCGQTFARQSAC
jgi:hypothetical protein